MGKEEEEPEGRKEVDELEEERQEVKREKGTGGDKGR